jgi:hypothetical protein
MSKCDVPCSPKMAQSLHLCYYYVLLHEIQAVGGKCTTFIKNVMKHQQLLKNYDDTGGLVNTVLASNVFLLLVGD